MSSADITASLRIGQPASTERSKRSFAASTAGTGALAALVGASIWTAAAATHGRYLLELPTRATPAWVQGPLHGLGGQVGPVTLSAALIVMLAAYGIALVCADALALRVVWAAVVLANVAFTLGPTIVSSDVFGYIAYAREAVHGLNPYVSPPVALAHDGILQLVYWKHQTSPYGPLFTGLSVPLGAVPPVVAFWTYKAIAGAAAIALAFLAAEVGRGRGTNPASAAIFVGLNPVLLVYAVSGGHNDLLAALLMLAAFALALRGREALGASAAVAAALIKLTLGLALPFVLIASRHRRAGARGATVALAVLGVPALILFGAHFFDQLQRVATDPKFDITFSGPDRIAATLGTTITSGVRALCAAAAGATALVMVARALRGADPIAAAGWAFLALIASIASLAPWYLVWLLPLAAIGRSRPLRIAAILATVYLIGVHLPALGGQPWLRGPAPARVADRLGPP